MKSRILVTIAWLSISMAAQAQYNYITNNGTITITGYTGSGGFVTIPGTINGLPVTDIGTNAFQGAPNLAGVMIPDSVTNIGDGAFYATGLSFLTLGNGVVRIGANAFASDELAGPLTLPNTLVSIGDTAFQGCLFGSITIPASVTNIGANPFAGCPLQSSVGVAANNPAYTNVAGLLFNKNLTTLVAAFQNLGGTYVVPNTVTNIGAEAFDMCQALTNVVIPSSVTSIGSDAFAGCQNLTNLFIPASVVNIGPGLIAACYRMKTVDLDTNNPAYISVDGILFDIGQTTIIGMPGNWHGETYTIPDTVTNIGDQAFYECTNLSNLTIAPGVVRIGNEVFVQCFRLTNVVIPEGVTSIGEGIANGISLRSIVIPRSITNLVPHSFDGSLSLSSLYFKGNPPAGDATIFHAHSGIPTVYYLPTASGWGAIYYGRQTAVWRPTIQGSGVSGGQFGFNIAWADNLTVTVQARSDLNSTNWTSLQSCVLTNGAFNFSDPTPAVSGQKFYRLSWP